MLLQLPRAALVEGLRLSRLLHRATGVFPDRATRAAYALTPHEHGFARELLRAHPRLWLYRSHQRKFCGDFVVVDMSDPRPCRRGLWVLDLKRSAPLRFKGGVQLSRAGRAVALLRAQGVVGPEADPTCVIGDRPRLSRMLGAKRRKKKRRRLLCRRCR